MLATLLVRIADVFLKDEAALLALEKPDQECRDRAVVAQHMEDDMTVVRCKYSDYEDTSYRTPQDVDRIPSLLDLKYGQNHDISLWENKKRQASFAYMHRVFHEVPHSFLAVLHTDPAVEPRLSIRAAVSSNRALLIFSSYGRGYVGLIRQIFRARWQ